MTEEEKKNADSNPSEDQASEALDRAFEEAMSEHEAKIEEAPEEEAPEAEAASEESEETEPKEESEDKEDEQAATSEEAEAEPLAPPENWASERKDAFAKLPREAQELALSFVKDTEGDYTRKSQELAEQRKAYEPLQQVLQHYEPMWRQKGIQPSEAVARLAQAQAMLENPQTRAQAFKSLAKGYGMNLEDLAFGDDQADAPVTTSQLQQLMAQQQQATQRQQQEAAFQQQKAAATAEIRQFLEAKDEQGTALYPHIQDVLPDFQVMAQAIRQQNPQKPVGDVLKEAYDRAVWANPTVRAKQLENEKQSALKAAEAARQAEVDKAKKAGKPARSKGVTTSGKSGKTDLDALIDAQMDAAGM